VTSASPSSSPARVTPATSGRATRESIVPAAKKDFPNTTPPLVSDRKPSTGESKSRIPNRASTTDGAPASNANPPSRYQVYRYEIEQGSVADRSPGGESGAPACYAGDSLPGAPDRRILYAALINCRSLGLNAGARWNIPVAAFGKLFLTLPLSRPQTDLYVELVDLVQPGDHVNLDLVQLYR